ncbi:hypothetical protein Pan216_11680 [Planctomycetes bacterium Pan216]|uniref:Uncharacterized protein n=1 Tax=Kolteria novifilia TaxID=2527975 RepID=A0A518B021_9BACT|nr:hypothetical protein Pan216_11680 [Planctomycetes bacterium Pan216]
MDDEPRCDVEVGHAPQSPGPWPMELATHPLERYILDWAKTCLRHPRSVSTATPPLPGRTGMTTAGAFDEFALSPLVSDATVAAIRFPR